MKKRVEGELHSGPHLTSMTWQCGMQGNLKPEKEESNDR